MIDPRRIEVIDDAMVEVLRAKTGIQRLQIAIAMFHGASEMIRANLRVDHPDWTEAQTTRETARRMSHGVV